MFPPIQTGTSFYSKNLADSLNKTGHNVKVITVKNNLAENSENSFSLQRIPALYIPLKNYFKHLRFCSLLPKNYGLINKIIKDFSPDCILLVNHYLDIAFPAIYAARKNKTPLYISVGTQLQSLNKIKNKILKLLDRLIVGNLIFPNAKKIICWDKEIKRYIEEVHSKKSYNKSIIVPYGVNGDISFYNKHSHDYNTTKQIIGIGAIIEQRNYLFQLRVFKELLKEFPHLKYKIIGHEYINKARKLVNELGIASNVIITGELPHEKVLEEIRKSVMGFTITSGYYTGLGTSTIETMLMGVPTVSKSPEDLFGSNAKLQDMHNYIYTDGESINGIYLKIKDILLNEELRINIGKRGKLFVEQYMNWEFVAGQLTSQLKN